MVDMIPGTNYQISGNNFVAPGGETLTQDQFVDKVKNKEISLTEGSLKFLESHGSESLVSSLKSVSGFQVPPGEISMRLTQTEGVMGDLYSLMALITQLSNDQRKQMQDVKGKEFDSQIKSMENSAKEEKIAGQERMWQGIITGAITVAASVGGGVGLGMGGQVVSEIVSKGIEGAGKITTASIFEPRVSEHEDQAKMEDINAKKLEEMKAKTQDTLEGVRQMQEKVKEILQSIQQAESQTTSRINSM
jgi:hypothetical protein